MLIDLNLASRTILKIVLLLTGIGYTFSVNGQYNTGSIHGNFELNAQYYIADSAIGTKDVPEKLLTNGFANFVYSKDNFSAGLRYESYLNPLLGFDPRYKGSGIPFRYLTYTNKELEVTVGNYYEQFGSGLVFRSYEERGLGLDNAMEGLRIHYKPYQGILVKAFIGNQRDFFSKGEGIVRGGDLELNLNELFTSWGTKKTKWILGGNFVSKYQDDQNPTYILPKNVGAGSGRINVIRGNVNVSGEYAYKINDPSADNSYIFKSGSAALLNIAYSQKGFGASLGAKRIDNMSFRSDRTARQTSLMINYLPAMTRQHTYILPAIYPYATQPNGEFAYQGEVFFNLKSGSILGGTYGTDVTLNYSKAMDIDKATTGDDLGYKSDFLKTGDEIFFEDINVEFTRKLSKKVKLSLMLIYLDYNKGVIQIAGSGAGHVYSTTAIAEIHWKLSSKNAIRTELQHLLTKQDQQNWGLLLFEYTMAPHWFVAGFDEYNYGNDISENRLHYYSASFGYTKNSNRISIGYGRQRAGIFCIGGVCRNVPASTGFSMSITSSF